MSNHLLPLSLQKEKNEGLCVLTVSVSYWFFHRLYFKTTSSLRFEDELFHDSRYRRQFRQSRLGQRSPFASHSRSLEGLVEQGVIAGIGKMDMRRVDEEH
jgi:hypothetical protein